MTRRCTRLALSPPTSFVLGGSEVISRALDVDIARKSAEIVRIVRAMCGAEAGCLVGAPLDGRRRPVTSLT
jgi:hypothetical protein